MRIENMNSQCPLKWPEGQSRAKYRKGGSVFRIDFDTAVYDLGNEVDLLGGRYPLLSTNIDPRLGLQRPSDPGVAIYFEHKGKQKVFACDTYLGVTANVRAIGITIKALRSIGRHGASDMLERALSAFEALPPPLDPWKILEIPRGASPVQIDAAFRAMARKHHPDVGGSTAKMAEINRAREEALRGTSA
jgi:hypothetical protein